MARMRDASMWWHPVSTPWPLTTMAVVLIAMLAGCAQVPPSAPPVVLRAPATVGLAADVATPTPPAQWWQSLGDPALNRLVEQALREQPGLRAVAARVARAEAMTQSAASAGGGHVQAGADVNVQRYSEVGLVPRPIAGHSWVSANVQLSGGIEWDYFGRHAAEVQSAVGQHRATQLEWHAAHNQLAARVVQGHVGLARLLALRALVDEQVALREAARHLVQLRARAGLDTAQAVQQAESPLPELRGQQEQLTGQIALARHQMAVLCGLAPDALADHAPRLSPMTPLPLPAQLGADLLGRRADVQAARWRVEAATQDLAAARAQFYPDINLVGFVGLNALGLNRLLDLGARQAGIGPAVRLPIFDAGRLDAQWRARRADIEAAIASYDGAVLDAVREASDAISTLVALGHQQPQADRSLALAEQGSALAQQRLQAGLDNRLSLLAAQGAVLSQRRQLIELQAARLDTQVALMRALGGGWTDDRPLASATVAGPP